MVACLRLGWEVRKICLTHGPIRNAAQWAWFKCLQIIIQFVTKPCHLYFNILTIVMCNFVSVKNIIILIIITQLKIKAA